MAFAGIMLMFIVLFCWFALMLLLLVGIILFGLRMRRQKKMLATLKTALPATGEICDCRHSYGNGKKGRAKRYAAGKYPYLCEFAVFYRCDDGMQHLSFFGIRSKEKLPYDVADAAALRLFPKSLLPVPEWIYAEGRSTDGRLPERVFHNAWQGVPIDETATVMLEADYIALQKKLKRRIKISLAFMVLCAVLLAAVGLWTVMLFI